MEKGPAFDNAGPLFYPSLKGRPDRPRLGTTLTPNRASRVHPRTGAADVFGRYGEEAFLLIMPNTALERASRRLTGHVWLETALLASSSNHTQQAQAHQRPGSWFG